MRKNKSRNLYQPNSERNYSIQTLGKESPEFFLNLPVRCLDSQREPYAERKRLTNGYGKIWQETGSKEQFDFTGFPLLFIFMLVLSKDV